MIVVIQGGLLVLLVYDNVVCCKFLYVTFDDQDFFLFDMFVFTPQVNPNMMYMYHTGLHQTSTLLAISLIKVYQTRLKKHLILISRRSCIDSAKYDKSTMFLPLKHRLLKSNDGKILSYKTVRSCAQLKQKCSHFFHVGLICYHRNVCIRQL